MFHPSTATVTNQADFLPHHYESIQATDLTAKAFPQQQNVAATLLFDHADGTQLTKSDLTKINGIAKNLKLGNAFSTIGSPLPGKGQKAVIVNIDFASGVTGQDASQYNQIQPLRDELAHDVAGTDLRVGVTGTLAQTYDQSKSGNSAEAIVAIATVLLIIVLLSLIFRSGPVTALPVYVIGVFLTQVANGVVDYATKWFGLQPNSSTTVMMIVVLFGVGTDYILFFLFRYRERCPLSAFSAPSGPPWPSAWRSRLSDRSLWSRRS
jgi:RND superfamily putative drug exporter